MAAFSSQCTGVLQARMRTCRCHHTWLDLCRGVGGVGGPIATLLSHNYSILDSFKQNMQTWRVSVLVPTLACRLAALNPLDATRHRC